MQDLFRFSRWRAPLLVLFVVVAGLLMTAGSALAVGNEPTYGTATVDGNSGEWNLTNDFYRNMYEAGDPTKTLLSKSYLRYDCATNTLYILVLVENGVTADMSASNAWMKVYDLSNNTQVDGNSSSFAWLPNNQGYEASFVLAEGDYTAVEIHLSVTYDDESGRTSSTGKNNGAKANPQPLSIHCPETGAITIFKQVLVGDQDQLFGFTLTGNNVNETVDLADSSPGTAGLFSDLPVGEYTINEDAPLPEGWSFLGAYCSLLSDPVLSLGAQLTTTPTANGLSVELGADEHVYCFFGNNYTPPPPPSTATITIIKDVAGGTDEQDFSFNAYYYLPEFGLLSTFSLDDDGDNDNDLSNTEVLTVPAGKYGVSEAGIANWQIGIVCTSSNENRVFPGLSHDPNNNGTGLAFDIIAGEEITCTFTNTYIPPPPPTGSLEVTKVVNWNGVRENENQTFEICISGPSYPTGSEQGACQEADFDGTTLTWTDLVPGEYNVSETDPGDLWTTTGEGNVSVASNQTATVEITNTHDEAGRIFFRKVVSGEGDPENPDQTFIINVASSVVGRNLGANVLAGGNFVGRSDLQPVLWTIRERNIPEGWTLDNIVCTSINGTSIISTFTAGDTSLDIDLAPGDRVDCTLTNSFPPPPPTTGALTITKDAQPDSDQVFAFTGSIGTLDLVDDGIDNGLFNSQQYEIDAGNQVVFETPIDGWELTDVTCTGTDTYSADLETGQLNVTIPAGGNVNCTFTNELESGTLTLVKTVPVEQVDSSPFFDWESTFAPFDGLSLQPTETGSVGTPPLEAAPGEYTITEVNIPNGWYLVSIDCGDAPFTLEGDGGVNVTVGAGEDVVCTFVNELRGNITIEKDVTVGDEDQVFDFVFEGFHFPLSETGGEDGLFDALVPDDYTITEENLPEGWTLDDVVCETTGSNSTFTDVEGGVTVSLASGEDVNCTFENSYEAPPSDDLCEMNPDSILVNGCFEEPVVSGGNWNIYDNVPGWDIEWLDGNPCPVTNIDPSLELQTEATLGNVDVINGDQYAELDTDCEGPHGDSNPERTTVEISQTLTTIPGHRYEVSFYFQARPNHINQNLRVTIDGNELFSEAPPSDWEERTFEFVATSTETVIAFADTGYANSYGVLLDCINVVDLGAEPTGDIWAFKYNDQNGNGSWFYEPALGGWEFMVYDSEGTQVGSSQNTDGAGFAYFNDLPVGTYTVCEVQQEGWTNTQPGTINETYGQPCVETEVEAEDIDILNFGNHEVETGNLRVIKQLDRGVFNPDTSDISFEVCVVDSGDNEVGCADLSQSNNWRYTWHDLPVGDYTVVETTDNLPEGWSPVISEVETTVEADTLSIARVRNVYVAPERPQAETCISLADLNYSEGTVIENQWLGNASNPQLVRVLTSTGNAQIVQFGGSIFGWVSNGTSDNFSGADPFAIMDMGHEHAYTFRFPNDIVVTGFSIRVYDWSDYNPANAREWSVELSAQGNSDTDGLSFSGVNTTGGAGDSYQALIGQPGNRRYAIVADSGNSFNRVYLNFDHDGNRPYTPSRHGQIDNPNSADPYLGLDELCITYEDLGGIRVTKFNDLNENGTRENGEDRLPGWTFNVYEGNEAVGDPIRSNVTNSNGRRTFGNLLPGTYTVCEVMQAGWTNVTPLCQTVEVVSGQRAELGFGNIELPPVTETCNASEVVAFNQGLDRNFNPIVGARSNPNQALGEPQDNDTINFVSLGFGGELILRLDGLVVDNNGSDDDLYFVETTFGNETPASYPESAEIFISLNPAGPWTSLGTVTLDGGFDFPGDGMSALYVRLVDVSNRGSFSSSVADAYDLDGIRCSEPNIPPVAQDDHKLVWYGQLVCIDVLANDFDGDADMLSIVSNTAAGEGTATLNNVDYVHDYMCYEHDRDNSPAPGGTETDQFDYTVTDGQDTDSATVNIDIARLAVVCDSMTSTEITWQVTNPAVQIDFIWNLYGDSDSDGGFDTATVGTSTFVTPRLAGTNEVAIMVGSLNGNTEQDRATNEGCEEEPVSVTLVKTIDWNGNDVNNAVNFELCLDDLCGIANYANGYTVVFPNVSVGNHTLSETPAANWTTSFPGGTTANVTADGENTFYIHNTADAPPPPPEEQVGTIRVTKNVVTPPAQHGDFTICINGAVFPEDQQNQPNCYNVHNNGDQIWWNVIIPEGEQSASYVISENNPGANWSVDGSGVSVTVYPNQTSYHTITNTYNAPPPPSCNGGMGQQSDLSGIITISGSTAFGTVYNNSNVEDCQYQIGMASYSKYDDIIDNQVLFAGFDTVVTIPAGGSVQISIALPECSAQVDLFYGSLLPDLNGQRYGSRLLAFVHNNIGYCQAPVINPPQEQPPQEIIIEEQQPPQEGGAGE